MEWVGDVAKALFWHYYKKIQPKYWNNVTIKTSVYRYVPSENYLLEWKTVKLQWKINETKGNKNVSLGTLNVLVLLLEKNNTLPSP